MYNIKWEWQKIRQATRDEEQKTTTNNRSNRRLINEEYITNEYCNRDGRRMSTQTAVIFRDIDLPGCCGLCDFGRPWMSSLNDTDFSNDTDLSGTNVEFSVIHSFCAFRDFSLLKSSISMNIISIRCTCESIPCMQPKTQRKTKPETSVRHRNGTSGLREHRQKRKLEEKNVRSKRGARRKWYHYIRIMPQTGAMADEPRIFRLCHRIQF